MIHKKIVYFFVKVKGPLEQHSAEIFNFIIYISLGMEEIFKYRKNESEDYYKILGCDQSSTVR